MTSSFAIKNTPLVVALTLLAFLLSMVATLCIINELFVVGLLYYSSAGLIVAILSKQYTWKIKVGFAGVLLLAWLLYIAPISIAFSIVAACVVNIFC